MSDPASDRPDYTWLRPIVASGLACLVSAMFLLVMGSDRSWGGPVILTLTGSHGIHRGDLPVAALWLVCLAACTFLGRTTHR